MPAGVKRKESAPQKLCARCENIDIEPFLCSRFLVPLHGIHISSLGRPRTRDFNDTCLLCKEFLSVAPKYQRRYKLELRLFDRLPGLEHVRESWMSDEYFAKITQPKSPDQRFLTVVRQNKRLVYEHAVAHEIGAAGVLLPSSPTFKPACSARSVHPTAIDYDTVTTWLQECISSHGGSCQQTRKDGLAVLLRAIDCVSNTVVPLSHDDKYVALSYLWGTVPDQAARSQSAIDNGKMNTTLPRDVPLTIKDAIQVVKSVGHRYLWVDRYCIPQSNTAERHEAITNMDRIYTGAEFTIVALYGSNSNAGLPGVSLVSRRGSQPVWTRDRELSFASTLPPLSTVIGRSAWSTRGWTFQEARLSRRCLFFSECQVYFSCHKTTSSETMFQAPPTSEVVKALNLEERGGLDPLTFMSTRQSELRGLFLDRLIYSQRSLTFQRDALDAFRGLLGQHSVVTMWGVPINRIGWAIDPCIGFAMGLLWMRRPPWSLQRHLVDSAEAWHSPRPGFPTWSWTSVKGEIFQDNFGEQSFYGKFLVGLPFIDGFEMEQHQIKPRLKCEVLMPASEKLVRVSLAEAIRLSPSNILPEVSTSIFLEGDLVKVKPISERHFCICAGDDRSIKDLVILPEDGIESIDAIDREELRHGRETQARDALVVVQWSDDQPLEKTRFVLILLRWVGNGIAERVCLLGNYRNEWKTRRVVSIPRRRRKFELR